MNATTRFAMAPVVALFCAIAMVAPGCAGTKNVMNKASFGLIGGSRNSADAQASTEETKAERKAREKEEKRQREAEKREQEEREKAEKAAAKEDKPAEERGLMNRMTFGLVGGKNDEEDQRQAEAKAAAKEQKRQEKEARKQQAKEEKAGKAQEKAEAEQAKADADKADASESPSSTEKRSLMSRMTFGLADGKSEEEKQRQQAEKETKRQEKEARKQQEREEKQAARERKEQEKAQAKQAKANAKSAEETAADTNEQAESTDEKRSLMSRMTFGLVGGKNDEAAADNDSVSEQAATDETSAQADQKAQKDAEKERRKAEKQAKKDAEKAEAEQAQPAEEDSAANADSASGQPQQKRTLMSRMTFGLVGGKKDADDEPASDEESPADATGTSTPAQPALPPEQLAMAAPADAPYDVQSASAMDPEARKLAKMPFSTAVDLSTKAASGKGQATASRHTYSRGGYGITDIGDVRIAVQGMTFDGESRAGGVIISSDDRAPAGGKSGKDNSAFIYEYAKGVTAAQFGTINFTISKSVISIGGKSIPIGLGKKLVIVDQQGNVIGAYDAE